MREIIHYDVVIVGAGPAGLAAAIRLKQLYHQHNEDINVCIVEKGADVGAHSLSGAVFNPRALSELLPNWQQLDAPLLTPATADEFYWLTSRRRWKLPVPPQMQNHGNYVISLGQLCAWLADQARNLGVEIYPGFAAVDALYDDQGRVNGIITGDMGVDKAGNHTDRYQPGIGIQAKHTLLAEGCRGSLTKKISERFKLDAGVCPQTYGIGIKELWEVDPALHQSGSVTHTVGWPLDRHTYGGSFIYHLDNNQVAVGFVVGLDYENTYLNPFEEMQRFKTHPAIKPLFSDARRLCYGARALVEGGWQSIPRLSFPGGLLIGDSAGFLNVPQIKGNHNAMKSGMLAADAIYNHYYASAEDNDQIDYARELQQSWVGKELHQVRNIRPAFRWGLYGGLLYSAIDTYLLQGRAPWTMRHRPDYTQLKKAARCRPISYPKPDGEITFDRLSSVFLSNTNHEENQPCHLQLKDPALAIQVNYNEYASPEQRYCPAGVYEILHTAEQQPYLQINAQNCVHCKTCDIKDPEQNINWVPPEGGGGPNYGKM